MDDVELDRSTATRLEVYKQQSVLRPEQIAGVWLAVQQLHVGAPLTDRPPQFSQRVAQKLPVRVSELRSVGAVANQPLRLRYSIREVRCREIDFPHASVQPRERLCILGWSNVLRRYRLVVGPKRDGKAVSPVDLRIDPRLKRCNWAIGFGESPSYLDFELCFASCRMRHARDPSKNVTRQQAYREPVRVVKNDRVIDPQVKR